MGQQQDDRYRVGQPWVEIPRSTVTASIVRELLGVMADTALSLIPTVSRDPSSPNTAVEGKLYAEFHRGSLGR
jgi:hypothetical protein